MWHELLADLGLESVGFLPAGLRAGAATHHFLGGTEIARLRFLGRWRNLQTLEHYIQEAVAAAAVSRIPKGAQERLSEILSQKSLFAQPPAQAWWHYFSRESQIRAPHQWLKHNK